MSQITRRAFVAGCAAAATAAAVPPPERQALIAVSLDLEMARNFPTWESTHWDYEKGNLNEETKAYAVEAARRVKAAGGVVHFFLVARALEQENVDWLKRLIADGHRIGNHTYDHVYIRAKTMDEVQFRFKRAPWLVAGKTPAQVIRENIRLAKEAIKSCLGIDNAGFRAPGGFADGILHQPELQKMLQDLGFTWVSTRYPAHPVGDVGHETMPAILEGIRMAQDDAQPSRYAGGLIEIPMSPISDVGAFRNARWKLEDFVKTIRAGVEHAVETGGVFDYLSHPAVLYAMDPQFKTIDTICDAVKQSAGRAKLVDLDAIAATVS